MLSPRSVICTPNRTEGRNWVGPLGAVGSMVGVIEKPSELTSDSDLILADVIEGGPNWLETMGSLKTNGSSAVIIPNPDLSSMVDAFKVPNVRSVLVKDYIDSRILTYVAAKLLWGDIFGLSKVMPWGVRIHSELVYTHDEREQALASISHFARSLGLRAKYRDSIELVVDELLMNAQFNAPVDGEGSPLFNNVDPKDRAKLRLERPVIMQTACDGARFAISVRDSFGSLQEEVILKYIRRCLSSNDQIDRKTSGAGLGLYLVANNVTEFIANLLPGTATEIICIFDLNAPRQQIKHMGIYQESYARHGETQKIGEPSQLVSTPISTQRGGPGKMNKVVPITLLTAVLLLLVAALLLVWPYLRTPPRGGLAVEVSPSGGTVYINGVRRGIASPNLMLKDLDVATPYSVSVRLPGYQEAREVVNITKDKVQRVKFSMQREKARIRISSSPNGAKIILDGKPIGQETPAMIEKLEPDREYTIKLQKYGFVDSIDSLTPSTEETLQFHVKLSLAPGFSQVSLESKPPGARLYVNDVDTGLLTPFVGHVLRADQTYQLRLSLPKYVPWLHTFQPSERKNFHRAITLEKGAHLSLSVNIRGAKAFIPKFPEIRLPLSKLVLPLGDYQIRIRSRQPFADITIPVKLKEGDDVTRRINAGFVVVKRKGFKIKVGGRQPVVTKIALLPGKHEITLVDTKTGQTKDETVTVTANKTMSIE